MDNLLDLDYLKEDMKRADEAIAVLQYTGASMAENFPNRYKKYLDAVKKVKDLSSYSETVNHLLGLLGEQ